MKKKLMLLTISVTLLTAAFSSPVARTQSAPQRIEITARRFAYTPGEITVKKGQPVTLVLRSADVDHGLRIREFGVNAHIKAGRTVEVTFTPDKTGDFIGHCSTFCGSGHGSMKIKLHVVA